jgi:hypothetical protein
MIKLYITCALLFVGVTLAAQNRERVISGQLKSNDDGSPLPGVNVVIKGTTTGTVTDADGRYSLSVPIGSVLVFSFIGMQTREVLVTETSLQPVRGDIPIRIKQAKGSWHPSILQDSTRDREGITTLTFSTPSYHLRTPNLIPTDIVSIRKTWWSSVRGTRTRFIVNTNHDQLTPKGLSIQFNNTIGFNRAGHLPQLQSSYSQGRNNNGATVWRGPDQLETMSWGAPVKTLEYTDGSYPYDRNGAITSAGTGNGMSVHTVNPYSFLRTGITTTHEISAWFPGISRSTTSLDLSRRNNQGIIPNNDSRVDNVSINMKRISFSQRLKADVGLLFNSSDGNLMNRGANFSNIMGSLMLSAPTFDVANGYTRKNATDNRMVYELPDGSPRSSAPGVIDNPYGLVSTLPDHEESQRLLSSLGMRYELNEVRFNLSGSFENQVSDITYGNPSGFSPYLPGRRTERHEERSDRGINFLSTYTSNADYKTISLSWGYQFRQEKRSVSRQDGFGYTNENFHSVSAGDSLHSFEFALTRNIQEIVTTAQYEYSGFDIQLSNRNYFSNTIKRSYVNLFPALIVKVDLDHLLYVGFLSELRPFASISRTIRESPALFGNPAMLSTRLQAQQYNQYVENQELVWNSELKPETELKFETGLRATTDFNVSMDFSYYNNTTYGLILPVWRLNEPVLQNVATIQNTGTNVSLSYHPWRYWNKVGWGISLRWTQYNSMVTSLDVPGEFVPLAGFNNIQTVVAKDQPLGAIYGTTWLKDEKGRKVIDNDGFPIVDADLKRIGNPIPNYLISLEPYISIQRRLRLSLIIDVKRGGQVWNGTLAALNYSGRSQATAKLRNAANYIFDGVTTNGVVNAVPVDFYDPALPLQQNRWVRYGFSGVGEEHIEDASWIRLNEISLSYKFYPLFNGAKKEVAITFIGKNLLLITPYSGVDPGTALYGYSTGTGLDLFNAPSLKSYNFLFTLKL